MKYNIHNKKRGKQMSSYYELRWRDDELEKYDTDKLNFIFNAVNHPLTIAYKQYYKNEIEWRKAIKKHEELIAKVKGILEQRSDAHNVRQYWLKQHNVKEAEAKDGLTAEQLANKFPYMANQLGAFMELENIEIKYFDEDFKPRYDLDDFSDLLPENYTISGFKKNGMTKKALLKLYPTISTDKLDQILAMADYEPETEDEVEVMPYWYAVNAKRMLVDGDSFAETFDA